MRGVFMVAMLAIAGAARADPVPLAQLLPGIYTTEEQAYFDKEAGKADAAAWVGARITVVNNTMVMSQIDRFGVATGDQDLSLQLVGNQLRRKNCALNFVPDATGYTATTDEIGCPKSGFGSWRITPDAITISPPDGPAVNLRRARPVTCWGSIPKTVKKPDGSEDWYFASGLKIHDQGGRVLFGGGDTGAPSVVLRMRNVIWPTGTNKPSLVLYVHKPDNPDHAEAYSWADPGAKRVGINLRWMQASCTVDGS